ncbi:MAG: DUF4974 domain-containing protein [Bacteroides sp.]|nr:DUF4974 domain-containing protein [Bacteroides sp.]
MANQKKIEDNIQFVARYYRDDMLLPDSGWEQFKATHSLLHSKRNIIAAAVGMAAIAATASLYFLSTFSYQEVTPTEETSTPRPTKTIPTSETNQKIEFHDASLKEVIIEIEKIYNVKITNVPKEEIKITISYEGTAVDVIETINELFDTDLKFTPNADLSSQ